MKARRVILYFILAAVLSFSAVLLVLSLSKKNSDSKVLGFKVSIEALKGVVLKEDKNLKTWSVVDNDTTILSGTVLSLLGEDSAIVLKVDTDILLSIDKTSSIKVTKSDNDKTIIGLLYGCFSIKGNGTEIPINLIVDTFGKVSNLRATGTYCLNSDGVLEKVEKQIPFITPGLTYDVSILPTETVSPCGEIIEADKDGLVSFSLSVSGLRSSLKIFQISSNKDFASNVFESKTYWNTISTTRIAPGRYYWRALFGRDFSKSTKLCNFEVVSRGGIRAIRPKNQESIPEGRIELEWEDIDKSRTYTLNIVSEASGVVQKAELKQNKYIIDDPIQTLGPGFFFWYVKDSNGNFSVSRSFYITMGQDIILETPVENASISNLDRFFPIIWKAIPGVKNYGVAISSAPSFMSVDYANTTEDPYVFVPMLGNGEHYLRISAIFDNNKRISTDAIKFTITDTEKQVHP